MAAKKRTPLDAMIGDIGMTLLRFQDLRSSEDFALDYGLPPEPAKTKATGATKQADSGSSGNGGQKDAVPGGESGVSTNTGSAQTTHAKKSATGTDDPQSVKAALQRFTPKGQGREKVVDLLKELRLLNVKKTPLAFCFVLRSMFEISAKAYCADHQASAGPQLLKADGTERKLVDVLRDCTSHMVSVSSSKARQKELHGAMTELARTDGLLSVTSMNQLVHNPNFLIGPADISLMFARVFPLMIALNA
jgi:hypothetical protein